MSDVAAMAVQRAAETYNAAADHFDDAPVAFWDRHSRRAVELAQLAPGERVLDVGCGTGASAIPAAEAVGPSGRVVGIDVAEQMLACARKKAMARGLANAEFRHADMGGSGAEDKSFDAIISVFSIFFVPDMERQVGELWRLLKPGGRLVVTVWGERFLEPAGPIFYEERRLLRPDLPTTQAPWTRLTRPAGLSRLIFDGGAEMPEIVPGPDRQPLADPSDWWTVVLGSGLHREIAPLDGGERRALRTRVIQRLADADIRDIETHALHAIARKAR